MNVGKKYRPILEERNITSLRHHFPIIRAPPSTIEQMWNHTMIAETNYFAHLQHSTSSTNHNHYGEVETLKAPASPPPEFWKELRAEFDKAIEKKWYTIDVEEVIRANLFCRTMDRDAVHNETLSIM